MGSDIIYLMSFVMDIDINSLMLFDTGIYLIASIFMAIKVKKISNHVEELAFKIKWQSFFIGFIFVSFYFMGSNHISIAPPDKIIDIESPEKILKLFQEYNKTITKISKVQFWSTFILAYYFLMLFVHITNFLNVTRKEKEKT